jgi:hypothetical protein
LLEVRAAGRLRCLAATLHRQSDTPRVVSDTVPAGLGMIGPSMTRLRSLILAVTALAVAAAAPARARRGASDRRDLSRQLHPSQARTK